MSGYLRSIKDPFTFAQTNVMGTLSLLQAAKIYWESLPEGIPAPFTTKASSGKNHEAYGEEFFLETTKYNPHSPYSASKASSDHFVRAFHDTYGMPTIVTNCSNNYGPYQFPEKLIPLFINNIRHRKPLPVYGKGENVRDWLYVVDHARAIDMIFHKGKIAETYNIGGFNEWKNIDIIKVVIKTVDRLLGRPEGADLDLITYVTDRKGHDMRYAIDSRKLQKELGWEPSLQFEEGIEETVKWYLDNQEWMDHVTSGEYQKYYEEMNRKMPRNGSEVTTPDGKGKVVENQPLCARTKVRLEKPDGSYEFKVYALEDLTFDRTQRPRPKNEKKNGERKGDREKQKGTKGRKRREKVKITLAKPSSCG